MFNRIAVGICLAMLVAGATAQERVSTSEKGSIVIFPKVELRWNDADELIQDTFISITNDNNDDVDIHMYLVSEECTWSDNEYELTETQPAYWAASTGTPGPDGDAVSPFTVLGEKYPDPEGSTDFVLRGYVIVIAVDNDGNQVRWNHLFGEATIVNYAEACAWEYNAYTAKALIDSPIGTPGELLLDGANYAACFNKLLLNFFATGATAFSGGGMTVVHDTDLTLLVMNQDLRQDTEGPYTTKAKFEIWNENEVGFSGQEYCITKWDERLLSVEAGHFEIGNLQTSKGYARIDGMASTVCDTLLVESVEAPLLGVAAKVLEFKVDPASPDAGEIGMAGIALGGSGTQAGVILYDPPSPPEEGIEIAPRKAVEMLNFRR